MTFAVDPSVRMSSDAVARIAPGKPAIEISGATLAYATSDGPVHALSDVSLTVADGEFVSLIGPSCCGKTTLLRTIADLEQPQSGTVRVDGVSAHAARLSRRYGYVFQAPALYPWRTVERNVTLPLELMRLPRPERRARAEKYLDLVRLGAFARKYPWALSGGMQQRVSIARALAIESRILLMDEPFGALDEIVRDKLNVDLLDLWRTTGKTIVFVTHSIPEAVFLSTRVVVMSPRPGRIIDIVDVDLPRERPLEIRETAAFLALSHRVREGLRAGHSYDD